MGKEKKCVRGEEILRKAAEREQQLRQGKKWKLSGDGRQGTPPRTISASIAKTPSREQSCWESKVVDAANCLFSGLLLKHLHFHTKWLTRSKASGKKTRLNFSPGHSVAVCVIKLKLWIIYKIWWMLLSMCFPGWSQTLTSRHYYSQQVLDIATIQWKNYFLWNQ